jgi:hypothetical protein
MADRTSDQILDQAVYALACIHDHYGPGLNENGLRELRKLLSNDKYFCDSSYICDVYEDDPYVDFASRILWPKEWRHALNFYDVTTISKSKEDDDYV